MSPNNSPTNDEASARLRDVIVRFRGLVGIRSDSLPDKKYQKIYSIGPEKIYSDYDSAFDAPDPWEKFMEAFRKNEEARLAQNPINEVVEKIRKQLEENSPFKPLSMPKPKRRIKNKINREPPKKAWLIESSIEKDVGRQIDYILSASSFSSYLIEHARVVSQRREKPHKDLSSFLSSHHDGKTTYPLGGLEYLENGIQYIDFDFCNEEPIDYQKKDVAQIRYNIAITQRAYRSLLDLCFMIGDYDVLYRNDALRASLVKKSVFLKSVRREYGFRFTDVGGRVLSGLVPSALKNFAEMVEKLKKNPFEDTKETSFRISRAFLLWVIFERDLVSNPQIPASVFAAVLGEFLEEVDKQFLSTFEVYFHRLRASFLPEKA